MWRPVEEDPWEEAASSGSSSDASSLLSPSSSYAADRPTHSQASPSTRIIIESGHSPTTTTITQAASAPFPGPCSPSQNALYPGGDESQALAGPQQMTMAGPQQQPGHPTPAKSQKGKVARAVGLLFIAAVAFVITVEILAWYPLYEHGWTAWYRHPLAPFKEKLDRVEKSGSSFDIAFTKKFVKYTYKLLLSAEGLRETFAGPYLPTQSNGRVWPLSVYAKLPFWPPGLTKDKRVQQALQKVEPLARELEEETGPLADGLDWWLAGGGAGLALLCSLLAFAGDGKRLRWLHALACVCGGLLGLGLAILYAFWLVKAALDVFGTKFMLCPFLYCLLFFGIAITFAADLGVSFYANRAQANPKP